MALERPGDDEQVARHLVDERDARRDLRRDLRRTVLQIFVWVGAGYLLMGAALHASNRDVARIAWLAGQTVWLSGVLWTLLAAYRRGARRGDW